MKQVLKNHSMVSLFMLKQFPTTSSNARLIRYKIILEREQLFGKFASITNHFSLTAEETMHLCKTKEKVEHEFQILKDLLTFHSLPHRIEMHNAIVQ
ncbi:MAG: hypothetical protein HeimC3_25910 [Candidatus Heimdallarchaeota archaeon LC_3]|nr:MAG: hypothetical protein HeimC3_25910 [Candidatus Heimdallarchaeota archaeon LC_3]